MSCKSSTCTCTVYVHVHVQKKTAELDANDVTRAPRQRLTKGIFGDDGFDRRQRFALSVLVDGRHPEVVRLAGFKVIHCAARAWRNISEALCEYVCDSLEYNDGCYWLHACELFSYFIKINRTHQTL